MLKDKDKELLLKVSKIIQEKKEKEPITVPISETTALWFDFMFFCARLEEKNEVV